MLSGQSDWLLFFLLLPCYVKTMTICDGFEGFKCPKRWQKQNKRYRSGLNVPTRTTPVFYKSVTSNCEYKGYKPGNSTTMSPTLNVPMSVAFAEGMIQVHHWGLCGGVKSGGYDFFFNKVIN